MILSRDANSLCNKTEDLYHSKSSAGILTACSLSRIDCSLFSLKVLLSFRCPQTSALQAEIFEKYINCFSPCAYTVLFIHTRELLTIISCWPSNTNRSSALLKWCWGKEKTSVPVSLLWKNYTAAVLLPKLLNICSSVYVLYACFVGVFFFISMPPSLNQQALWHTLYLLTVTLQTRAASPPSVTKTCRTTRTSGTCKSFMAYTTRL